MWECTLKVAQSPSFNSIRGFSYLKSKGMNPSNNQSVLKDSAHAKCFPTDWLDSCLNRALLSYMSKIGMTAREIGNHYIELDERSTRSFRLQSGFK